MAEKVNFKKAALAGIADWETVLEADKPFDAGNMALFFFYLGDYERAREASAMYSVFLEKDYYEPIFDNDRLRRLFDVALYASLAQDQARAETFWRELAQQRRTLFPETKVLQKRTAEVWIYEAYARLKLGEFNQVAAPAQIGLEGLRQGKGRSRAARRNKREYGLAGVLLTLSAYKQSPSQTNKELDSCEQKFWKRYQGAIV